MDTNEKIQCSVATLANANELAYSIVQNCLGNDVSDSISGKPILRATILSLTQSRIQADKTRFLGVQ